MPPPILIVGMYKSGTSWLLNALNAHPDLVGLREIDLVSCALRGGSMRLLPVARRVEQIFGANAWCSARGRGLRAALGRPDGRIDYGQLEPREFVAAIRELHPQREPDDGRPLSVAELDDGEVGRLFVAVRSATGTSELVAAFLEAHQRVARGRRLVLKAADQLTRLPTVAAAFPGSPRIVMLRDGRDASVSAVKYRELVAERGMAWFGGRRGYDELLRAWRERVRMLRDAAISGEVVVLRYEDLHARFDEQMTQLLGSLGHPVGAQAVAAIREHASFKAMTGREPGQEAREVIRKGVPNDWMEQLDEATQDRSWRIAGRMLRCAGYRRDGGLGPLALDSEGSLERWSRDVLEWAQHRIYGAMSRVRGPRPES